MWNKIVWVLSEVMSLTSEDKGDRSNQKREYGRGCSPSIRGGGGGGRGLLLAVGKVSKICGYATVVSGRPWEGTEVGGRPWGEDRGR